MMHRVNRSPFLSTIIECISAARDVLTLLLIHSRKTIDEEVSSRGLSDGVDVAIGYSESCFINADSFKNLNEIVFPIIFLWNQNMNEIVFPIIFSKRKTVGKPEETAIAFMNNASMHVSDTVNDLNMY